MSILLKKKCCCVQVDPPPVPFETCQDCGGCSSSYLLTWTGLILRVPWLITGEMVDVTLAITNGVIIKSNANEDFCTWNNLPAIGGVYGSVAYTVSNGQSCSNETNVPAYVALDCFESFPNDQYQLTLVLQKEAPMNACPASNNLWGGFGLGNWSWTLTAPDIDLYCPNNIIMAQAAASATARRDRLDPPILTEPIEIVSFGNLSFA